MNALFSKNKLHSGVALALLLGGGLATSGAAQAANIDFVFNTANIVGSTTAYSFTADEITLTSVGLSSFTLTDTTGPFGVIGAADDFAEVGLTAAVNFQNNNINIPVGVSGINLAYEMIADFTIKGVASLTPAGNVVMNFSPATGSFANIYYDETLNSLIDPGASLIGKLTLGAGDCVITAGTAFTEGSCKITFAFDKAGVTDPGVFKYLGADIGTYQGASMTMDINGNNISTPGATLPLYPVSGVINGTLDHDGSAVFNVPEPATVAMIGLGLLGIAGFARRGAAKA